MASKTYVINLFNSIAPTYDRLNHILSLNIDRRWRSDAVSRVVARRPTRVLDLACGTGDFTLALAEASIPQVVGGDFSARMLEIAEQKISEAGRAQQVMFSVEDAEHLSFEADSFDAVTVAFGVRNFANVMAGLREMSRVLRPGGQVAILELSVPSNGILLKLYKLYFLHILPFIGGRISGNREAYEYLPMSVLNFPAPDEFQAMMRDCGFEFVQHKAYNFGICRLYTGLKKPKMEGHGFHEMF
jgi:demethylmenaquinone methyltransferase/2-methoxy-6-polyprenyl-1,4-benzoquinol methylase